MHSIYMETRRLWNKQGGGQLFAGFCPFCLIFIWRVSGNNLSNEVCFLLPFKMFLKWVRPASLDGAVARFSGGFFWTKSESFSHSQHFLCLTCGDARIWRSSSVEVPLCCRWGKRLGELEMKESPAGLETQPWRAVKSSVACLKVLVAQNRVFVMAHIF